MAKRKQQEVELQAAIHGIPMEKQKISRPTDTVKPSTADFQKELAGRIAKGLPVRIMTRKK